MGSGRVFRMLLEKSSRERSPPSNELPVRVLRVARENYENASRRVVSTARSRVPRLILIVRPRENETERMRARGERGALNEAG